MRNSWKTGWGTRPPSVSNVSLCLHSWWESIRWFLATTPWIVMSTSCKFKFAVAWLVLFLHVIILGCYEWINFLVSIHRLASISIVSCMTILHLWQKILSKRDHQHFRSFLPLVLRNTKSFWYVYGLLWCLEYLYLLHNWVSLMMMMMVLLLMFD